MSNLVQAIPLDYTQEQLRLITATVAKGASPDELKLFLYRCKNLGLDPLKPGQIHFVKYGSNPGTIVIGIEGFRSIAARTLKLSGIKRGVIKDSEDNLIAGWAEVYRSDWKEPAREESPIQEYNTGKGIWATKPETMIKKVAEAAALRMAFPDDLGGVYETAEMEKAAPEPPRITPDQPEADDGIHDDSYRIPFGKFQKRTLEEVGVGDLRSYIHYIESKAAKDGKPLTGKVLDFVERASEFISAFENGSQEPEDASSDLEE